MSLTNRLTTFFAFGLALVLIGFSLSLFLLARLYLHRQLDERLDAALNTLVAVAEIEEGAIEWSPGDRHLQIGGLFADTPLHWSIHDDNGRLVDCSKDLDSNDALRHDISSDDALSGTLPAGTLGENRRAARKTLSADSAIAIARSRAEKPLYGKLIFTVRASEAASNLVLSRLASALAGVSFAIFGIALISGRWFCRRALRPLQTMALQAGAMNAELSRERLSVPASNDEVAALGQSFNGLLDRLHVALQRQQRFTGDASHQLRTPLTALLGEIEVALRYPRSLDDYRRTLERLGDQGRHLQQIVEMLLYLARANAEAQIEKLALIDLCTWLPAHLKNWSKHERYADLQYVSSTTVPCRVRVQAPLLGQLIDNLIDNAFKYSQAGSLVLIELQIESERAILIVADHGQGIAEEDLSHLFEPFYRGQSTASAAHTGVGLGLSIAERIAQLFGGELTVSSTLAQGSRFRIAVPRAE